MKNLQAFFLFLLGLWGVSCSSDQFLQENVQIYTLNTEQVGRWSQLPFADPIMQVESCLPSTLLLTSQSLYKMDGPGLIKEVSLNLQITSESRVQCTNDFIQGQLVIVTNSSVYTCNLAEIWSNASATCKSLATANFGDVTSIQTAFGVLWIGSSNGLFNVTTSGKAAQVSYVDGAITSIAYSASASLAAGSSQKLFLYNGNAWRYEWVGYIIDAPITGLAYRSDNTLWIGNSVAVNLLYSNGTFARINGPGGLPFNNITSVSYQSDSDSMWFGTTNGTMRYSSGTWKYYYGPRWLWGQSINAIASSGQYTTLIATNQGLTNITFEYWTLEQKADYYQSFMVAPRHLRMGLAGSCDSTAFGVTLEDPCVQQPSDNDGLWTSMYLASQAFRYAVTKDPSAKANAWQNFEALEMINNVSGITGLPARSFTKVGDPLPGDWWRNSTAMPGYMWKGDTSSDELSGHFFVYPIFADLVCETDEEKQRPIQLMHNIASYVVENDFYLIDTTGEPTTWGKWNPEYLNANYSWGDQRGINSLQILSWLATTFIYTKDSKIMDAYQLLTTEYGYNTNILNVKITAPSDINYSDDELMFLNYFTFLYAGGSKFSMPEFTLSLQRSWAIAQPEKASLWNAIYGASGAKEYGADDLLWTLQNWPLSLVDWATQNSQRLDYFINEENAMYQARNPASSLSLLPWDERTFLMWNGSPYVLDNLSSGQSEYVPTAWLLSYWMARYYGLV